MAPATTAAVAMPAVAHALVAPVEADGAAEAEAAEVEPWVTPLRPLLGTKAMAGAAQAAKAAADAQVLGAMTKKKLDRDSHDLPNSPKS